MSYICMDRTCHTGNPCPHCIGDDIYPFWAWVARYPGAWDHNWRTLDGTVQRWHGPLDLSDLRPGDFEHHDVPGLYYRTWLTSQRFPEVKCRCPRGLKLLGQHYPECWCVNPCAGHHQTHARRVTAIARARGAR